MATKITTFDELKSIQKLADNLVKGCVPHLLFEPETSASWGEFREEIMKYVDNSISRIEISLNDEFNSSNGKISSKKFRKI